MLRLTPCLTLVLWAAIAGCTAAPADPDLNQAQTAIAQFIAPQSLQKSCFAVVHPNGTASDFVDYFFSDLGSAEWPIAFDAMEAEQMQSIGQAVIPPTVAISPGQRQQRDRKELVLQADDGAQVIRAQGYGANSDAVVLTVEWPLNAVTVGPGVAALCQSNLEMGISPSMRSPQHSP